MDPLLPFRDRADAGRQLAASLARFRGVNPLVLGIPRGGVPVARIIADALDGELDVILVRKLGAPGHREFAIGAVDERGEATLDRAAVSWSGADADYLRREIERELAVIRGRRRLYRAGQPGVAVDGRTVIVVDDGLATGSTMLAALQAVRAQHPAHLVCAVPVAAHDSLAQVERIADEVVALAVPRAFGAVGLYYRDFEGVGDDEVVQALKGTEATGRLSGQRVQVQCDGQALEGELVTPAGAKAVVIFAHGSGSSRHSPRNRLVAEALNRAGFSTLLLDLLTAQEDRSQAARFDIGLLARRLQAALDWARAEPRNRGLPVALFGASTGAAAALVVAARSPGDVAAVVSRGGRPDLAGAEALALVRSPTLLLVGGADPDVLALNRAALAVLGPRAELTVVPGATHLFEEPGALAKVASLSSDWLARTLPAAQADVQSRARHG